MKELLGTARNIYAVVGPDNKMLPTIEVILIATEPQFTVDASGAVVRTSVPASFRITTTPGGLRSVAKDFLKWADDAEEVLAALD